MGRRLMTLRSIARTVCFIFFFSVGGAALVFSILVGDLAHNYRNKQRVEAVREAVRRSEALNTDYDVLLRQLETDPNILDRIAPAVLGEKGEYGEQVLIKAESEHLELARQALSEVEVDGAVRADVPGWLERCIDSRRRTLLFLAGAFLILISFIWFGPLERDRV